ncbi:MAG: DUF881 domain-containing protein [Clostridiales bacterium]|nr:DUF881 domain-containing protein [Clostridiales bacterium]
MKVKNKNYLLIGFISIVLGLIISIQLKVVQGNYLEGSNPLTRSIELSRAYETVIGERDKLLMEINQLQTKLQEIENDASSDNAMIKGLTVDLERYKLFGGFLDVSGQGIQVILDNPVNESNTTADVNIIYEYDLINILINELNAAGAEAISINDERIISISEIRTAGSALVINKVPKYPPFIIKAIGNKDTLDGALNQIFGIASTLRNMGYFVEVKKSDNIEILKYNGIVDFNYAKILKK